MKRLHAVEGWERGAPSLRELRALGAIIILKGGKIDGIACVDPRALHSIMETIPEVPMYLASWRAIEKALQQSEELLTRTSAEAQEERNKRLQKVGTEVLELITQEVHRSGTTKFYLERFDGGLDYSFKPLLDASQKKGRIHPKISETVWNLVMTLKTLEVRGEGEEQKLYLAPSQLEAALIEVGISERQSSDTAVKELEAPIVVKRAEEPRLRVVPFPAPRNEKPLMLIVEDNVDFAKVLTRYFKRYPVEILHYTDGAEAFRDIVEEAIKPDLTICDLHMPSMHGLEFLKRLRLDLKAAGLPVIMLTSDDELETQIKLVESGADVFLAKSTHPRVLEAHVRRILHIAPTSSVAA